MWALSFLTLGQENVFEIFSEYRNSIKLWPFIGELLSLWNILGCTPFNLEYVKKVWTRCCQKWQGPPLCHSSPKKRAVSGHFGLPTNFPPSKPRECLKTHLGIFERAYSHWFSRSRHWNFLQASWLSGEGALVPELSIGFDRLVSRKVFRKLFQLHLSQMSPK